MKHSFFRLLLAITAALATAGAALCAQAQETVRIGVLTDMQGGGSAFSGKGSAVAAQMAVEDFQRNSGSLPFNVVEVKRPEESRGPWDYLKVLQTIPADKAFRPASEECALVKR